MECDRFGRHGCAISREGWMWHHHLVGYSCAMNGLEISSSPSTGLSSVIVGPRSTVRPSMRVRGSGPCMCSSTSSRTRLNNWSYPLSTPVTSRPPVNLTRMRALAYFARSRIASRFGLSSVGWGPCGPPWRPPPRWEDDPPRCAPRPMPPRPRSDMISFALSIEMGAWVRDGM